MRRLLRVVVALAAIALDTAVCRQIPAINPTTVGFVYLLTVLLIASEWGLLESVVAALAATACYNFFFLPPLHTFTIAEPQNWVALFAFLGTSLIASKLSERARRRRDEAISRRLDLEQLHSLSRAILLIDTSAPVGRQIAAELARVYDLKAAVLYDRGAGESHCAGPEDLVAIEPWLREAAVHGSRLRGDDEDVTVTPFSLGGQPIGSLALKGQVFSDAVLESLSNLVAIGMERARVQEAASRATAARHREEFKSALLDAVAHEFKTPLTAIKAATSAILSSEITKPEQQRELTGIIDQEADRLLVLVSEAIHLARIEAGKMRLQKQACAIESLVRESLKQMETVLEGRAVEVKLAPQLPELHVDAELIRLVLRHLLDNAVKYSPPSAAIRLSAEAGGEAATIRVWNGGPGLPEWEKPRIFEKFYRGTAAGRQAAGTGMGLAIARQIMLAHGGDIQVESSEGQGVEFSLTVPIQKEVLV
ncbi:MAG: DUF4118 domain-containing protein [Acidobacteria bacterium]|nr:DUF4118 domain-containing protein [Acidobacteriota bacterium]